MEDSCYKSSLNDYLGENHKYSEINYVLFNVLISQDDILYNDYYARHTNYLDDRSVDEPPLDVYRIPDNYHYLVMYNVAYKIVYQIIREDCPQTRISNYLSTAKSKILDIIQNKISYDLEDEGYDSDWADKNSYHILGMVLCLGEFVDVIEKEKWSRFCTSVFCYGKKIQDLHIVLRKYKDIKSNKNFEHLQKMYDNSDSTEKTQQLGQKIEVEIFKQLFSTYGISFTDKKSMAEFISIMTKYNPTKVHSLLSEPGSVVPQSKINTVEYVNDMIERMGLKFKIETK